MTTNVGDILFEYIELSYGSFDSFIPVKQWLTEDIVKLIQLMDAELQRRYDEEQAIRKQCQEAFQTDLFNGDDDELEEEHNNDIW